MYLDEMPNVLQNRSLCIFTGSKTQKIQMGTSCKQNLDVFWADVQKAKLSSKTKVGACVRTPLLPTLALVLINSKQACQTPHIYLKSPCICLAYFVSCMKMVPQRKGLINMLSDLI